MPVIAALALRASCQRRHHPRRGRGGGGRGRRAIVNDVSGGLADPEMAARGRRRRGAVDPDALARAQPTMDTPRRRTTTTSSPTCATELLDRVDAAVAAGVDRAQLVLDPGLGFAKTAAHNWALLRALPDHWSARGLPGAGRRVPQALPGRAARRARRAAPARRPGGRHRRRLRAGRRRRGVGGAGARRRGRRWTRSRSRTPGHCGDAHREDARG